jgi:hypothetical protein
MAQQSELAGTWEYRQGSATLVMALARDGSATLQGKLFKYTATANRLALIDESGAVSLYTFQLNGDELTLVGERSLGRMKFVRTAKAVDIPAQLHPDPPFTPSRRANPPKDEEEGLAGKWQSQAMTVEIFDDGTLTINGDKFRYRVDGRFITLANDEGTLRVEFQLTGDTLTTLYQGERTVYQRVRRGIRSTERSGGSNPPELFGKWCYMSNVTANNGGRMSNTCFTLYPNGTYDYYSETSSSNPYGGTSSQSSDSGTWSVSGATLIANSRSQGRVVYTLEKRNHPKTGDPMLMVDGDAFVTYTQRPPW